MKITSTAFADGGEIPRKFTCQGADVSPPLTFAEVPAGAKALALICDDPDAPGGTWVHWVLFNLPGSASGLAEGQPKSQFAEKNVPQGVNDFERLGYGGPCPPPGKAHRYFFKLYALKEALPLQPGAAKAAVEKAMAGKILADASLVGTYRRS